MTEQPKVDMVDREIQTDNLFPLQNVRGLNTKIEEKGINTVQFMPLGLPSTAPVIRGRGGITIMSGVKQPPSSTGHSVIKQQSLDIGVAIAAASLSVCTGPQGSESSILGERRQRMSRAHSAYSGAGSSEAQESGYFSMANMTLEERRRWRMAASNKNEQITCQQNMTAPTTSQPNFTEPTTNEQTIRQSTTSLPSQPNAAADDASDVFYDAASDDGTT